MAAIDHLFSDQPACRAKIDEKNPYFKQVREGIAEQAAAGLGWSLEEVRQQMGYTEERGAEKTETFAIIRWVTTQAAKAADWQATLRIAYAFGLLRIGGIALEEQMEVDAAVSLFSYAGYQTEKFEDLMLEKKVAESFEFLTGSRTLLQLFVLRFLHRFMFKPLILVTGDNLGCWYGMVGMGSHRPSNKLFYRVPGRGSAPHGRTCTPELTRMSASRTCAAIWIWSVPCSHLVSPSPNFPYSTPWLKSPQRYDCGSPPPPLPSLPLPRVESHTRRA